MRDGQDMITSSSNPQVRKIIQLNTKTKARRQEGLFVAEGRKMLREAPGPMLQRVYASETFIRNEENRSLLQQVKDQGGEDMVVCVRDDVFRQMSDTVTPQGILALLRTPRYLPEDLCPDQDEPGEGSRYLVLENIQDPGNMGTIFRTAEAAGIRGIFLTPDCVDVTSPKVIRGTMGAVYRMPWCILPDVPAAKRLFQTRHISCYAAAGSASEDYDRPDYTAGCAFFIGNEGNGLSPEALAAADRRIRIPMEGLTESLNAAVAAGILMYEAFRQVRHMTADR